VCNWMDRELSRDGKGTAHKKAPLKTGPEEHAGSKDVHISERRRNPQLDFIVHRKRQVRKARRKEAELIERYRGWLSKQKRRLPVARHGKLECDGIEKGRGNLIEAKSEASREKIRMAVGQVLDYAFNLEKKLGKLNMAILIPKKPQKDLVQWLDSLKISVVWEDNRAFLDNANGRFT